MISHSTDSSKLAFRADGRRSKETVDNVERTHRKLTGDRSGRVLIIDDQTTNVTLMRRQLHAAGFQDCRCTTDSRKTLELVKSYEPDLIISDVMMPHVSGIEILDRIRNDPATSHVPVVIITASTDERVKIDALERGATDFLNKPIKPDDLIPRLRNALAMKVHHDHMAAYSKRLEAEVALRTAELEQSRREVIHVLACASEYRDHETGNHVIRVGRFAGIIARQLGIAERQSSLIEQAAILHDAGKIGIADSILLKPDRLTEPEFALMKLHCEFGARILTAQAAADVPNAENSGNVQAPSSPILKTAAVIAMTHHEKWDGTGYPKGLSGTDIPLEGRITAVADVFDALSSDRCYKDALPLDECLEIMIKGRGKHFDPVVLDAFLSRLDEIVDVVVSLCDEKPDLNDRR